MITNLTIKNFGPIGGLEWNDVSNINLIIGRNGAGKSFLLKALYSAMRTLEEYRRGNDPRTATEILADKLYWTFQPDKLGELVTKGADAALSFKVRLDGNDFSYAFGKDTTRKIAFLENLVTPRSSNSIFLPAKEVLSLHKIILRSRDIDRVFGFDDTYVDLARALSQPTSQGRMYEEFSKARKSLAELLEGRIYYDNTVGQWSFWKGNQKFSVDVTAEGIKKISILDTLLGNRYLNSGSIVFIDEPESALHPAAISKLMDIIAVLASAKRIQFFLASHSYFVIKKLCLIAQRDTISIPVLARDKSGWYLANLQDGMPENEIIDESIKLYEEEVDRVLQ